MSSSDANLRQITQSTMLRSTENDGVRYDSEFARIEELIKGNTFTRDEITRLVEILNSRADKEEQTPRSNAEGDTQPVPWMPEMIKTPSEGKHPCIERTMIGGYLEKSDVPVGVGASPIDIARAYMAGRTIEEGQDPQNIIYNSERAQPSNEFARKPLLQSPSPKPSICWPGAVVHNRHDHSTPQSQRARSRLHDFPRTPYSRTLLSKSTMKLQVDSASTNTSTSFQQLRTPLYGQGKLRGETGDAYGSVGPIRRIRNKFSSEVRPRGSIFLSSPKEIPPKVPTTQVFGGFLPSAERNLLPGETSGVSKYWSGDNGPYPSDRGISSTTISSSARKALELLDRNKPTPKQKEAELKLVTAQGSSPDSTDVRVLRDVENRISSHVEEPASHASGPKVPVDFNRSNSKFSFLGNFQGNGMNEARARDAATTGIAKDSSSIFTGSSKSMFGADAVPIFGLQGTSGPQAKSLFQNALTTGRRQSEVNAQFPLPVSNGQDAKTTNEAEALKNHGTKPSLPSISINRPQSSAASTENGPSFTFPVSASACVLSEPPTPSITPSSSASLISQPISAPTIPSYSFGTKKSGESVVFSFPSTSNAPNPDDSDLKFSFGSAEKNRLSFSSFGTDAICY